ncbi:MAG: 16S rRNA (guanine(527)-N(7))-methyltransferase RsmG [Bacteroidia bacterium]|nr:16S rRNA (guanine(527)-N(7))-methyltransferase RsmG [Bacteroidia bacterium]
MPEFTGLKLLLEKYFPQRFSELQIEQFEKAFQAYLFWNPQINVISRKDIDNLAERHFLHALGGLTAIEFAPETRVMDVGTGGGFPGIPLAIAFPEVQFHLVDSIAKKIKVVENIVQECGLGNVSFSVQRAEQVKGEFDFVTGRAVTRVEEIAHWVKRKIHCRNQNSLRNGMLYLKGGEADELLAEAKKIAPQSRLFPLGDHFTEAFFSSKFLVHIPFCK